ncbi:MAG TPA: hypothetical protein VMU20_19555 [Candidatus Dormibacteraeota bacterium]|nr:hypothetical protein [Candidatus Dormibacteraeota bacterium]
MSPAGRSRGVGVLIAVLAVAAASTVARPAAGPAVADKPCATGDGGGGLVHCSDVGNDSLNGISIHILGH